MSESKFGAPIEVCVGGPDHCHWGEQVLVLTRGTNVE